MNARELFVAVCLLLVAGMQTPTGETPDELPRVEESDAPTAVMTSSAWPNSTFVGGSWAERGRALALDGSGNIYVTGDTSSPDFPTTPHAFQPRFQGGLTDAFLMKLNPTGSRLLYSTYLGGSRSEAGRAIAVDASGNVYVTGSTSSLDFPATPDAFQRRFRGGITDAFVVKLNPSGSATVYSTYLGGSSSETGRAIALDAWGNIYVSGSTSSPDFPTTVGAFQPRFAGGFTDAFLTELAIPD